MVRRLAAKDLYLHRWRFAIYPLVAILDLLLLGMFSQPGMWLGLGLAAAAFVFCLHLPATTAESTEQTLAFVMSLPISAREYAAGKILANLLIFLFPWAVLLAGSIFLAGHHPAMTGGMIPWVVLLLFYSLAGYCLILGIGLVAESPMLTIAALMLAILVPNSFIEEMQESLLYGPAGGSASAAFSGQQLDLLVRLGVAIVLIPGLAFYLRSRRDARPGLFSGK